MRVLQTLALPLGHVTIFGATVAAPFGAADEARTRYLHLGKVALYQMSYGRILETLLGLLTGASDRNRTNDTGIFSPLLYRLSYRGIESAFIPALPRIRFLNRGPRKNLRSKCLWGRGESLAFITAVLLARLHDEQQDFRRSDPDRARTADPLLVRQMLSQLS